MTAMRRYGPPCALATFVLVGSVKDSLVFLPVDATLLAAAFVSSLVLLTAVPDGFRVRRSTVAVLAVFGVLTLGLVNASLIDYSLTKSVRLFTLTLLAAAAPTVLLRSTPAMRRFLNGLAIGGAGLFVVEVVLVIHSGEAPSTALPYGRLCAPLLVWATVLAIHGELAKAWLVVVVPPILLVMGVGGLRGPLAAAAAAIALALVRTSGKLRYAPVLVGLVALAVMLVLQADPDISSDRVDAAPDQSRESRIPSYGRTVAVIESHPLGVGWGDWGQHVHVFDFADRQYPHDIVLEVTAEAGWATGALLVGVLTWLTVHGRRLRGAVDRGTFAVFVVALGLALVSGDINDNRLLFVLAGCLVTRCLMARQDHPEPPPPPGGGADEVAAKALVGA